jgi:hypothetical protein
MDAAVGQAVWLALHETGHAVFDIFDVPIFGHSEDAADNFATYVMLHFGKQQAWRWINGAAWAWRGYVADYRTKPVIQEQLAGFASNHGQPQERFYNLMCLAFCRPIERQLAHTSTRRWSTASIWKSSRMSIRT